MFIVGAVKQNQMVISYSLNFNLRQKKSATKKTEISHEPIARHMELLMAQFTFRQDYSYWYGNLLRGIDNCFLEKKLCKKTWSLTILGVFSY